MSIHQKSLISIHRKAHRVYSSFAVANIHRERSEHSSEIFDFYSSQSSIAFIANEMSIHHAEGIFLQLNKGALAMTDLHCHLLPSVDDGVQTEEESLKILKEYKANGIDTVVFTPHINHPTVKTDIETIKQKYTEFKPKAEALGIKTYLGSELYLQPNKKNFIPLFNSFALIEMPTDTFPVYFMNTVFDLQLDAYEIIIAHVERYSWLLEKPEMIAKLKEMGVYFQVNLTALENKKAEYYRKNNLIDLISTDNHGNKRKQTDLSAYKKYPEITQKMQNILSPYL